MKFIKRLSKRTRIISLMVLLVIVSATTIAFLQDYTGTITNSFSLKNIQTEIEENIHSTSLTKAPFVENTGDTDVMVRVRLEISGDFSKFALAGIDTNYVVGYDGLKNLLRDDFIECGKFTTDDDCFDFWISDIKSDETKYSCYYYYKNVLKAKNTTQPLFDKILLRLADGKYIAYDSDDITDSQKTEFADLENIQISLYQESVPVVLKDDDTTYNADENDNGIIDAFEEDGNSSAKNYIWDYFMTAHN